MKFLSVLFSALSLVAFSQAAAVVAEKDMATQHAGVCPAGTAQVGKNKGYHDDNCRFDDECCSKSCETIRGHCR